jgi:hypothetical protein
LTISAPPGPRGGDDPVGEERDDRADNPWRDWLWDAVGSLIELLLNLLLSARGRVPRVARIRRRA